LSQRLHVLVQERKDTIWALVSVVEKSPVKKYVRSPRRRVKFDARTIGDVGNFKRYICP
jgi:hypothetical protein